jgi:hypothetical protein
VNARNPCFKVGVNGIASRRGEGVKRSTKAKSNVVPKPWEPFTMRDFGFCLQ